MQEFKYGENDYGPARQVKGAGGVYPAKYLFRQDGESDAAWAARLGPLNIKIVSRSAMTAAPNTHDQGEPVKVITPDGWEHISYPNPVPKIPYWNKVTKEIMYATPGTVVGGSYTDQEPLNEEFIIFLDGSWVKHVEAIKTHRNAKLTESDWTQLQDCPLPPEKIAEWKEYRQKLRDIPQQAGFPDSFDWPVRPSGE